MRKKNLLLSIVLLSCGFAFFGTVQSTHALSDGFYSTGKKEYYVSQNLRVELKKGKELQRLIKFAQHGGATPISTSDLRLLRVTCEHHPEISTDMTEYQNCQKDFYRGVELGETLAGKLIMQVDSLGELYYVKTDGSRTTGGFEDALTKKMNGSTLRKYIKKQSKKVTKESLFAVPRWKGEQL